MKYAAFIKPCNEIQLAHLYEHLYVRALIRYCLEHQLFSYIDYHLSGFTAEGCFAFIGIWLYTSEAQRHAENFASMIPDFSYDTINGVLAEIAAEERVSLIGEGTIEKELTASLRTLHQKPWVLLNHFTQLDSTRTRRSFKKVWTSSDRVRTKTLTCELRLDQTYASQNRAFLPLFYNSRGCFY